MITIFPVTATIEAGSSLSTVVDNGGTRVVGIIMPDAWTAARVSVQVSADGSVFHDLFNVNLKSGTSPSEIVFNVEPGVTVPINPNTLMLARYIKLRSGTRDEPVNQEADRTFTVLVSGELSGEQGPPGPAGPQGEAGPQGPQGPQGIQGSQGAAGTGITMRGSVPTSGDLPTQATQGDAYIVQADDSLWIYDGTQWVSGGSIQGPPGAQGPQGPQGLVGLQGPVGASGAAGATGPAGPSAVSANAGNLAKLGTDNLILVPDNAPRRGVTDGTDAAAGMVGEVISSSVTVGIPLTTLVVKNVTQITLPPGDWAVGGVVIFTPVGTGPNAVISAVGQTSAVLPTDIEVAQGLGMMQQIWASSMPSGKTQTTPTSLIRVNTSVSKTVHLMAQASFGGGSVNVTGYISARRVR